MITNKEMEMLVASKTQLTGKVCYQVTVEEMRQFDEARWKLAEMIGNRKIQFEQDNNLKATVAYDVLEDACQISTTTMKKSISGTLKITRSFLYKVAVGLHMSIEEANEYFELCGGFLNAKWGEDYICIKALEDGDSIDQLIKQYEDFADVKIAKRNRSDAK